MDGWDPCPCIGIMQRISETGPAERNGRLQPSVEGTQGTNTSPQYRAGGFAAQDLPLLAHVLESDAFVSGRYDTGLLERIGTAPAVDAELVAGVEVLVSSGEPSSEAFEGESDFLERALAPPGVTLGDCFKASFPYLAWGLILLLLIFFIPEIATWLPSVSGAK